MLGNTTMASALRKSLIGVASRYTSNTSKYAGKACTKPTLPPNFATRGLCGLTLTRSITCTSVLPATQNRSSDLLKRCDKLCGCRSYHSEGDKKIAHFLKEEISNEKKGVKNRVTQIEGWTPSKDGTKVILTKTFHDEKIKVSFDVNNSVDMESFEEEGNEVPPMVSRPNFEVEIKKSSGKVLKVYCEFEYDEQGLDAPPAEQEDQIRDQFNIIDVHLGNAENSYSLQSSVMDADMYEFLMDMLDERGVDDIFITNMVDFSTTYEHDLYVNFLADMKDFIEDK